MKAILCQHFQSHFYSQVYWAAIVEGKRGKEAEEKSISCISKLTLNFFVHNFAFSHVAAKGNTREEKSVAA